jgi:hypothetical protein
LRNTAVIAGEPEGDRHRDDDQRELTRDRDDDLGAVWLALEGPGVDHDEQEDQAARHGEPRSPVSRPRPAASLEGGHRQREQQLGGEEWLHGRDRADVQRGGLEREPREVHQPAEEPDPIPYEREHQLDQGADGAVALAHGLPRCPLLQVRRACEEERRHEAEQNG